MNSAWRHDISHKGGIPLGGAVSYFNSVEM